MFGGKAEAAASLGWVRGKECPYEKAPGSHWDPSECAKSPRGPVKVPRGHIPEGKSKNAAEEEEGEEKGAAGGDNTMRQSEQAEALRNVTDCKDERITGSWQVLNAGEELESPGSESWGPVDPHGEQVLLILTSLWVSSEL